MSLVQAVFSSLSTENTSGNFTISKIGFFKKWVHMKLWDTNIRSWDDGQANSPVLTFELSVDRTVYRAQEQTFARFSKTMWLNFMWLNTTGKSLSVRFTFENTPNFPYFHRILEKSQVIFYSLLMHSFSCGLVRRYLPKNFMQQIHLRTRCSAGITPSEPAFCEARWTSGLVQ